jgi:hypothetical protein
MTNQLADRVKLETKVYYLWGEDMLWVASSMDLIMVVI